MTDLTQASILPWVEKFRPSDLNDVVSHQDAINTIQRFIVRDQLPHLLFHGPPGTGKTSTVFAIARTLYGEMTPRMMLELNASDDRGINVVRDQIKTFAKTSAMSFGVPKSTPNDSPVKVQKLKLIVLDEADQMTRDAQNALRRIMEQYADHVRFCIICNLVNKINPAIQSRCTKFRFPPLTDVDVKRRTNEIAKKEGVDMTDCGLEALVRYGRGDMRRVLNSLQSAAVAHPKTTLNEELILRGLGLPQAAQIADAFKALSSENFRNAYDVVKQLQIVHGYSLNDIVHDIYLKCLRVDWPPSIALIIFPRLAEIEYRLSHGATEGIEVSALVSAFVECRSEIEIIRQANPSKIK
eukprot:CAMPEP_0113845608 /NCGR_PEP_ID=MMETSP0372-20130328/853_1 /TAXON_ID=340204 /ORGANISM="Lankesteria abbotti" /LENGTH=353 /DNA_ID=CAMNT_0000814673 /DNA_START=52 /DNA_END=1113 /DNA_ORIENTATION=- /assembly_acc=CAM_ASM_000359